MRKFRKICTYFSKKILLYTLFVLAFCEKEQLKKLKIYVSIVLFFGFQHLYAKEITIVAAANLKPAMDSILEVYKSKYPSDRIQVIYGASGKFYEQILHGAPFDLFFSADMNYPSKLIEKKIAVSTLKLYAIGRLTIWSNKLDPNIQKMNTVLNPNIKKIAIANPVTAPYGIAAIESMKSYKVYDKIQNQLVYGENIAQAAQFASSGAADLAFIALSESLSLNLQNKNAKYWTVPQESHKPLEQGCVILQRAKENASAIHFFNFISTKPAIDILKKFGYSTPKEN